MTDLEDDEEPFTADPARDAAAAAATPTRPWRVEGKRAIREKIGSGRHEAGTHRLGVGLKGSAKDDFLDKMVGFRSE